MFSDGARESVTHRPGDLEAEEVESGILLRPVAVVDRGRARRDLMAIVEEDKLVGPEPRSSFKEKEQAIFDEVAAARNETCGWCSTARF